MKYETHITVILQPKQIGEFQDFCVKLGGKAIFIDLVYDGTGNKNAITVPFQPMFGRKFELVSDQEALMLSAHLRDEIADNFTIIREKVEAEIPTFIVHGKSEYYEAHWKSIGSKIPWPGNGLLLSRSAVDRTKFWITKRLPSSCTNPVSQFEQLTEKLVRDKLIAPQGNHFERVVFDSNPEVDKGWA